MKAKKPKKRKEKEFVQEKVRYEVIIIFYEQTLPNTNHCYFVSMKGC